RRRLRSARDGAEWHVAHRVVDGRARPVPGGDAPAVRRGPRGLRRRPGTPALRAPLHMARRRPDARPRAAHGDCAADRPSHARRARSPGDSLARGALALLRPMSPLTVGIAESAWFDRLTKSVEPEGIDSLAQDRPVEGC